ncbi:MAG: hypothetical protein QOD37_1533 [Gaiellales bacterium]|jgi:hypothetical protein|nr:hypothetical protein [Gaiellales bacterium]
MTKDMSTADIAGRRVEDADDPTSVSETGQSPDGLTAEAAASQRPTEAREAPSAQERRSALLEESDSQHFRGRWSDVQTHFVDGPREAVQDADALVAELMQHLATTFAEERASLERQWTEGQDVSTEDLRVALKRYRSFFDRLLEA